MRGKGPFKTEAEFVAWISSQASRRASKPSKGLTLGIGDDAALVRVPPGRELILTADLSIEGVHFTTALHSPESVGHRALARSLSDIAAMGGTPRYTLISLAITPNCGRAWLKGFFRGLLTLARRFEVDLIGGDTSVVDGACIVDAIVAGEVARGRALCRSGACPGDLIYVSGRLGMSALGLRALRKRMKSPEHAAPEERQALRAHLFPEPQCALGQFLSNRRLPTAMMDLSDGLSIDLARLCEASRAGATVFADRLPAPPIADREDALALALHGGEDYQLLFTVPRAKRLKLPNRFGRTPLRCIGEVQAKRGVTLVTPEGKPQPLKPAGYDHFARR